MSLGTWRKDLKNKYIGEMALENVHLIYHHGEGHEAIPASCLSGEWV